MEARPGHGPARARADSPKWGSVPPSPSRARLELFPSRVRAVRAFLPPLIMPAYFLGRCNKYRIEACFLGHCNKYRIEINHNLELCHQFFFLSCSSAMESKAQQSSGSSPPKKPWERPGPSSCPAPFKPTSAGSTSDVVEASGTAQPGEVVSTGDRNTILNRNTVGRPVPTRPWEQQTYGSTYGGYGSGLNNNSGYGTGTYGSSSLYGPSGTYGTSGGFGGSYGSGLYGNNMYGGGYGGLYGGGMNGGGMYNSGFGGPMGGHGMGMGGPYGEQDPNNPYGAPSSPPGFWISLMRVMHGVVNFFGRFAVLIDQNTQAFHMFMTALLQLLDRSGLLYGELARFVLRLLGIKTKPKNAQFPSVDGLPGPHLPHASQNHIEGHKSAPNSEWDGAWGNDTSN